MINNYFKTALRFLLKNKTFSLINIFGLAAGTLCCLYILLYVQDQYSYDKHHKDAADIFRITTTTVQTGDHRTGATCSPPIAPAMKNDFPEVAQYTRVIPTLGAVKHLLQYKERSFYEDDAVFVDTSFFDVFTYHFIYGNASNSILKAPYSVVLLKPVSVKLFGDINPVDSVITIDDGYGKHDFKVTGVVDESAGKSHIHANLFMAMNSGGIGAYVLQNTMWAGNNFAPSYVKLHRGTSAAELDKKLPAFLNKYGGQQLKESGMQKQLHLEPVTAIHTTQGYEHEFSKTVSPTFLSVLLLIAFLIQTIACINFMNLSTARASKRAREVGVRKTIGARTSDLIKQFLSESLLLSFIGVAIALPSLVLALPFLNEITQTDIHPSFLKDYRLWLILTGLILGTGLVAGSYPAFYLSAFKTIKVIKGNFTNHISANSIRRSLVVFQFILSITLISCIIIIYSQLNYLKNKDIGFDKDQKLIFSFYTGDTQSKMQTLANDLRQLAEVKAVSSADTYLSQYVLTDHGVYLAGGNLATAIDAQNISTDENFVKAYGIVIHSGRDLRFQDSSRVLINETLAKRLGLDPITAPGTRLYSQNKPNPVTSVEIVGVMKDFNFSSLHEDLKPFMLVYDNNPGDFTNMVVSTSSTDYKTLLGKMEAIWHRDLPSIPFDYAFLDTEVQKQYETEATLSRIINSFTLMAILISCLGLFGLAAFSAEQRNKEIAVRKTLGATVSNIVGLLTKDFIKLVFIAMLIATPLAWWGMSKWLQTFAYRMSIGWWIFALAGLVAILITLFTISFQSIKAALANPVKSLKSE
jgi:putative ABC transport system permease protein